MLLKAGMSSLVIGLVVWLGSALSSPADEAATEVQSEVKHLTKTCLTGLRSGEVGFPQLLVRGYSLKERRRRIDYTTTLKVRQAMLSRPKVQMHYFKQEQRCLFGFLHLAPNAAQGLEASAYEAVRRMGYKQVPSSARRKGFTLAQADFAKGNHKIRIVLSSGNGFVSFGIDEIQ